MTKNNSIELSIQVGLNGLSFSTLDRSKNAIDFFKTIVFNKKQTPFYVKQKLEDTISIEPKLQREFLKVTVIHDNNLSTLVPKTLFNENHLADYLKFNAKILQTDFISYDALQHLDIMNVYVPYVNINNYIYDTFGEFIYKHNSSVFIDNVLNKDSSNEKGQITIDVSDTHFDMVITKNGELLLYNTFDYKTKEDFIYFILFTSEQLKLDTEALQLELLGKIDKESPLYTIAYQYIRHVSFGSRLDTFAFTHDKPISSHANYTLLKSL